MLRSDKIATSVFYVLQVPLCDKGAGSEVPERVLHTRDSRPLFRLGLSLARRYCEEFTALLKVSL